MSEPDAGSDVASIRTRAVRDGDDFVVNGQKIWNSGAASADFIYLIVRTDPDAPPHAGLSELIVDMRSPGITIQPIKDMTASDHFCEVWFEDVRVPAENLVGELNGSFRQVMRQMEHERGGIDRLLSNRKLYVDVLAARRHHRPAGAPGDRGDRDRLPDRPADGAAGGARPGPEAVLRRHQDVLHRARAAHRPVLRRHARARRRCSPSPGLPQRVSRNVAYAPAYTIMGGTTQILRNIIGERMLGLPGRARRRGRRASRHAGSHRAGRRRRRGSSGSGQRRKPDLSGSPHRRGGLARRR